MESFIFKYWPVLSWITGLMCTVHGSVLLWLLKRIEQKVGRPEFENRIALAESQIAAIHDKISLIYHQNGEMIAGIKALETASVEANKHIKEQLDRLENRPHDGRRGD